MYKFSVFDKISFILVIIGAVAWGIFGLTPDFNIVRFIFGNISPILERIVYLLVAASGINILVMFVKARK